MAASSARALLLGLGLLGCAPVQAGIDIATVPAGAFGPGPDTDVAAINLAQAAFADASVTYGKPDDAARAAAALIYVAGSLNTTARWQNVTATTQQELLQGRQELMEALGVVPGTSVQVVVNRLLAARTALAAADEPAAERAMGPPVFAGTGAESVARLAKLPYLRLANLSTIEAADQMLGTPLPD